VRSVIAQCLVRQVHACGGAPRALAPILSAKPGAQPIRRDCAQVAVDHVLRRVGERHPFALPALLLGLGEGVVAREEDALPEGHGDARLDPSRYRLVYVDALAEALLRGEAPVVETAGQI